MSHAPSASGAPPSTDHDANAKAGVERFLGGESASYPIGNQPLEPRLEGGVKVFELTIDEIEHRIDAVLPPVAALGYNKSWPGPRITVTEGDTVRAIFKNNLKESTGVHFHGQRLPNAMDGVPHITQEPIPPGGSFTYEFTGADAGLPHVSLAPQRHRPGRPRSARRVHRPAEVPADRYDRLYGATQDIVWISNDTLGGFTINGRGFPATAPIVAKLGDKIVIRFMNEGQMMHPWHLHGVPMRVVARDGYPTRVRPHSPATRWASTPASAGTSSSIATSPERGPSTATSSSTPRGWTGCTAWSRRSSSRTRRPLRNSVVAGAPAFACVIPTKVLTIGTGAPAQVGTTMTWQDAVRVT
jgi:FtsP/CotA-like multicopper oxidase with cupredoxin domain